MSNFIFKQDFRDFQDFQDFSVGAVLNRAYGELHSVGQDSADLDLFEIWRSQTTEGDGNRSAGACPPRAWPGEGQALALR